MGHRVKQTGHNFTIRGCNKILAMAALQNLLHQESGGCVFERHMSSCDWEAASDAGCLEEVARALRWGMMHYWLDDKANYWDADVISIGFLGEFLFDDFEIMEALAPFVEPGSWIQMKDEDGRTFRWRFDGKIVYEVEAKVCFNGEWQIE